MFNTEEEKQVDGTTLMADGVTGFASRLHSEGILEQGRDDEPNANHMQFVLSALSGFVISKSSPRALVWMYVLSTKKVVVV